MMIIKKLDNIEKEDVTMANSTKTTIQWLITKNDGAERFTMRRFDIEPGGSIGLHEHPEDHEIYVLQGNGTLIDEEGNEKKVEKNDIIYVPPDERHGYRNDGNKPFSFICVIPYL